MFENPSMFEIWLKKFSNKTEENTKGTNSPIEARELPTHTNYSILDKASSKTPLLHQPQVFFPQA